MELQFGRGSPTQLVGKVPLPKCKPGIQRLVEDIPQLPYLNCLILLDSFYYTLNESVYYVPYGTSFPITSTSIFRSTVY